MSSHFWDRWPSLYVEIVSGLALAVFVLLPLPHVVQIVAASVLYEAFLDQNGWSWKDVGQRMIGIAVGVALYALVTGKLL